MNTNTKARHSTSNNNNHSNRNYEFRYINGRMETVGLPLPIELAALQAQHAIKPHTPPSRRTHLQSIVTAGRSSLRTA